MSKNKMRIRKGDVVVVIAGKGRGTTGKVLRVDPEERRVAVEGIRVQKRHVKPVGENPGGVVYREALIDVSNVALWDAEQGRRVKVSLREIDGKKVRVDRKTGAVIDKA